jgi:hypothetical protein
MAKKSEEPKRGAKPRLPKVEITKGDGFRAVYASGVFGGLDPNDGRMIFFLDRLKPRMRRDKNVMAVEKVERELQVEVHMSPAQFISMSKWMNEHAHKFGRKMKTKKKEGHTSYIG